MLNHEPFYWSHIRKYIILMGTLLNDIKIKRVVNGKELVIDVPVSFAQKDRILSRLKSNPDLKNSWKAILPRIGFEMLSPMYAPQRKDNTNNLYMLDTDGVKRSVQYPAAPYDIPFVVSIWTEYYEDALQIVEQIIPFFQPDYYVSVKEIPELDLKRDVSVSLLSVTQNDMYEGGYDEVRIIEWQLEFTLKGFFYGPIENKSVIKRTLSNFIFDNDFDNPEIVVSVNAEINPIEADISDPYTITESKIDYE